MKVSDPEMNMQGEHQNVENPYILTQTFQAIACKPPSSEIPMLEILCNFSKLISL